MLTVDNNVVRFNENNETCFKKLLNVFTSEATIIYIPTMQKLNAAIQENNNLR